MGKSKYTISKFIAISGVCITLMLVASGYALAPVVDRAEQSALRQAEATERILRDYPRERSPSDPYPEEYVVTLQDCVQDDILGLCYRLLAFHYVITGEQEKLGEVYVRALDALPDHELWRVVSHYQRTVDLAPDDRLPAVAHDEALRLRGCFELLEKRIQRSWKYSYHKMKSIFYEHSSCAQQI